MSWRVLSHATASAWPREPVLPHPSPWSTALMREVRNGTRLQVIDRLTCCALSERDRTGKADRVNRDDSRSASVTPPSGPGGEPSELARAAGAVGVQRSSGDPPESKTGGERKRGTWVIVRGHGEGRDDGRGAVETVFDRITPPAKVQKRPRALQFHTLHAATARPAASAYHHHLSRSLLRRHARESRNLAMRLLEEKV